MHRATASAPPALELRGLTKRYDDGLLALEGFDLTVPAGEFFGLLGPNGAGKTTLISAVCNLIRVTGGEIRVFGRDHATSEGRRADRPRRAGRQPRSLPHRRGDTSIPRWLLRGGAWLRATSRPGDDGRLRPAREGGGRAPKLSGGMRRRLLLARALMHEPPLVILDEPTAGVDFELRLELWRYIRRPHERGTTILLTTHYLEEAEELCAEIALIRGGQLLARDSAAGLRATYEADSLADVYVKAMAAVASPVGDRSR